MKILLFFRKLKRFIRSPYVKHILNMQKAADFLKMASGNYVKMPTQRVKDSVTFYAIGDAGAPTSELKETALAMNTWASKHGAPDMILGLGDNFYTMGVTDVSDPQFKLCWSDVFLKYEHLRVPWRMILGNHDYMGSPQAQIDFTTDKRNVGGFWQLPNTCYSFDYDVHTEGGENAAPREAREYSSGTQTLSAAYDSAGIADPTDTTVGTNSTTTDDPSASTADTAPFSIEFFGLDTNGCQQHVARVFPTSPDALLHNIQHLQHSLHTSTSDWKIVFGHHPCFSQGRAHGRTGQCLRQSNPEGKFNVFSSANIKMPVGFGLEEVLQGGVSAYFCAHEHVFQVSILCVVF